MGAKQSVLRAASRQRAFQHHLPLLAAGICSQHVILCHDVKDPPKIHLRRHEPVSPPAHLGARERPKVLLDSPDMMEKQLSKDSKRNIVLLGLTGVGKSTLGNSLTRSQTFSTSDSMTSVTSKVLYKDFVRAFPCRIIDTPGFFDTTMGPDEAAQALQEFASIAREGISAIIIVVKNGRFTQENQEVLKFIEAVLGTEALEKYCILVVTHTRKNTQELESELMSLPEDNLGRQLASKLGGRIIGVERPGPLASFRNGHPDLVLQAAEKLFELNSYTAVDCDMMNWSRMREQLVQEYDEITRELRESHEQDRIMYENDLNDVLKQERETRELLETKIMETKQLEERRLKEIQTLKEEQEAKIKGMELMRLKEQKAEAKRHRRDIESLKAEQKAEAKRLEETSLKKIESLKATQTAESKRLEGMRLKDIESLKAEQKAEAERLEGMRLKDIESLKAEQKAEAKRLEETSLKEIESLKAAQKAKEDYLMREVDQIRNERNQIVNQMANAGNALLARQRGLELEIEDLHRKSTNRSEQVVVYRDSYIQRRDPDVDFAAGAVVGATVATAAACGACCLQ